MAMAQPAFMYSQLALSDADIDALLKRPRVLVSYKPEDIQPLPAQPNEALGCVAGWISEDEPIESGIEQIFEFWKNGGAIQIRDKKREITQWSDDLPYVEAYKRHPIPEHLRLAGFKWCVGHDGLEVRIKPGTRQE